MLRSKSDCTGCKACVQICPQKCISMQIDKNGFDMPVVDIDNCIDCNLCERVCHLNSESINPKDTQRAYAASSKKVNILNNSTSGGIFSEIALEVLNRSGVVYGCAYGDQLKAVHTRITSHPELLKLNGSKYVQSDIGTIYLQVEDDLKKGTEVLFSGTPCQVAGLKSFLRRKYDKLTTIDIVCHGVTSPKFFESYLEWYQEKQGCILTDYNFRSKSNNGWSLAGVCSGFYLDSKKPFSKNVNYYEEYYYYYFLSGDLYRESCYTCKYANLNRPGDFTLGDLWGAEGLHLQFVTGVGCSLVICNTEKANSVLKGLDIHCEEISLVDAIKYNKQLQNPSTYTDRRKKLIARINEESPCDIEKMYYMENKKVVILGKMKRMIPKKVKQILLKKKYK